MEFKHNSKGLSLLEVLLVVGVMTVMVTGVAQIFDDWFKRSVNQKVAVEMSDLQNSAEQYVKLNHEYILNDQIPNLGQIDEVDFNDMIAGGFLSPDYRARNSFGQSLRVFVRHVDDNTVQGVAVEVVTVSDDLNGDSRMVDSRLFDAALAGGPKLGLISAVDLGTSCCDGNIQSPHGEWSIALSDYSAVYNRTPDVNLGGYMAAYGRVSLNDSLDERFLYRVEIENRPQLNRMMTNMDMNGQDIVNAGTVVSDNMQVRGNATMAGSETNGFSSPYVLSVRDNLEANGLQITRDGDTKGDLVIQGDNDNATYDLNVTGNLSLPSASGVAVTKNSTVNTVQNMGSGVFDTLNARGGSFNAGSIVTVNTQINNDVQTTFLQTSSATANSITASSGITALTTVSGAETTIGGDLNSDNNIAVNGNASLGNTLGLGSVSIQSLDSCTNGCP